MSSETEEVMHYDGPPVVGITPDRAIFLYHLRVNPHNVPQSTGSLSKIVNGVEESRCAIGLGCQAFKIDVQKHTAYALLSRHIQLGTERIADIWRLNDRCRMSFAQIADRLEAHFLDPTVKIYDVYVDRGRY